jgi:allantoin racemase
MRHTPLKSGFVAGCCNPPTERKAPYRSLLGQDVAYARPEGVTQTTDLLKPEGRARALACAERLLANGARVIAFSCTGFSTIGLAPYLRERLGCVVVDAVDASGMFAVEMLGGGAEEACA